MVTTPESISCAALTPSTVVPSCPVEYWAKKVAGSDSNLVQAPACNRADERPSMRSAAMFCTMVSAPATNAPPMTSSDPCTMRSRSARATNVPRTSPVMEGTSRPMIATSVPREASTQKSRRLRASPNRSSPATVWTSRGSGW